MKIFTDNRDYYDHLSDNDHKVVYNRKPFNGNLVYGINAPDVLPHLEENFDDTSDFFYQDWLFVGGHIFAIISFKNSFKVIPESFRILNESHDLWKQHQTNGCLESYQGGFKLSDKFLVEVGKKVKIPVFVFCEYHNIRDELLGIYVYKNIPNLKVLGLSVLWSAERCFSVIENYLSSYILEESETQLPNEIKIAKHGFNGRSFRRRKENA